jgi:hypothetical protein
MTDRTGPGPDPLAAAARSGHPEVSWSILLDCTLDAAPLREDVAARVQAGWPSEGRLGLPPLVSVAPDRAFDTAVEEAANLPYGPDQPLARVLLSGGSPPRLCVAAHHAALDGLGLVALLSLALGVDVRSATRGVGAPALRRAGWAHVARRAGEAVLAPPVRIAPDPAPSPGAAPAAGDHLVRAGLDPTPDGMAVATGELIAAAAGAVRAWNRDRGAPSRRIVVAVGASRRPGSDSGLTEHSTWLRLRVPPGATTEAVRAMLASASPEPLAPRAMTRPTVGRLALLAAERTGSTLLVSNLGRLQPAGPVTAAALYPSAHGRSGISIGAVTVAGATTLTVRARRRDFGRPAAAAFLDLVAGGLSGPSARP